MVFVNFEPSVPLPRARLVAVRRPNYSECIKLSYRVRPVHLDFSQNPALLTSCQQASRMTASGGTGTPAGMPRHFLGTADRT
jgi:hypothetical protein